jgi:cephalosporin-C deacetylase
MPLTDLPLDELRDYRPEIPEPEGFDDFWATTLASARAAGGGEAEYRRVDDPPLATAEVYDVRFPGWDGQPVAGWLLLPKGVSGPLPGVVTYIGYTGGRGRALEHLLWCSAGYAHLVVDSRGQGHATPDPDPSPAPQYVAGFMTRGIDHPDHHYYRRLMTLATAALAGDAVAAALVDVPFLCHYRRGAETASEGPYVEIARYLGWHQARTPEETFATLSYFDGVHFAPRATAPALFSAALMDPVCPPSTVFAAYNRYAGEKDIAVWPFGDHSGGRSAQRERQLRWLAERGLGGARTSG